VNDHFEGMVQLFYVRKRDWRVQYNNSNKYDREAQSVERRPVPTAKADQFGLRLTSFRISVDAHDSNLTKVESNSGFDMLQV